LEWMSLVCSKVNVVAIGSLIEAALERRTV